jgi:glycosyltransferase involved in cell wall biosynthesis
VGSVDVFVPCYRYGRFLRECVSSVLSQDIENLRVLIIDDASPDQTSYMASELLREDTRIEYMRHKTNRGHIATYNEGIDWASADYMLLLSADDILLPGALRRAVELMDAHPEVGFTYGHVLFFPDGYPLAKLAQREQRHIGSWKGLLRQRHSEDNYDINSYQIFSGAHFIASNYHCHQVHPVSAVVRTTVQKTIGGYKEELPHAADMEMFLQFAANAPVGYIHAYQGAARIHNENMSVGVDRILDLRERHMVLNLLFERYHHVLSPDLKAHMYRGLAEVAIRTAAGSLSRGNIDECKKIMSISRCIDPQITGSLLFNCVNWSQRLGPKTWSVLRPVLRTISAQLIPSVARVHDDKLMGSTDYHYDVQR